MLEDELAAILGRLQLPTDSRAVLVERLAESIELARAGAGAIALENVCDSLFDFGVGLTREERDAIVELCARWSASSRKVQRLDDLVAAQRPPRAVVSVGGLVAETRVTLGVHGEDLDPREISRLVGCQPSRSHRRGDARPRGAPPWPRGAWLLSVEGKAPVKPEELLCRLLDAVTDDAAVWTALRNKFTVSLGLGLFLDAWNRGFELSSEAIARVVRVAGSLDFDIYGDGAERED